MYISIFRANNICLLSVIRATDYEFNASSTLIKESFKCNYKRKILAIASPLLFRVFSKRSLASCIRESRDLTKLIRRITAIVYRTRGDKKISPIEGTEFSEERDDSRDEWKLIERKRRNGKKRRRQKEKGSRHLAKGRKGREREKTKRRKREKTLWILWNIFQLVAQFALQTLYIAIVIKARSLLYEEAILATISLDAFNAPVIKVRGKATREDVERRNETLICETVSRKKFRPKDISRRD